MKKCNKCLVELSEENEAKKNKKYGRGICKKCRSKDVMEYQKKNVDSVRKRHKKWRRSKGIGCEYPCIICEKEFKRRSSPHLCSDKCRLFYYMKKTEDCWIWIGGVNRYGYGKVMKGNMTTVASRLSYTVFKGDIKEGMFVCHTCDTPSCINPDHLWLGTHQDNMDDMVRKNRQYRSKNKKDK